MRNVPGLLSLVIGLLAAGPAWAGESVTIRDLQAMGPEALKAALFGRFESTFEGRPDFVAPGNPGIVLVGKPYAAFRPASVCQVEMIEPLYSPPLVRGEKGSFDTQRRIVGLRSASLFRVNPTDPLGETPVNCGELNLATEHFFYADGDLDAAIGYATVQDVIAKARSGALVVECDDRTGRLEDRCTKEVGALDIRRLISTWECESDTTPIMCTDAEIEGLHLRLLSSYNDGKVVVVLAHIRWREPKAVP